jgi:hypothetical protein
LGLTSYCIIGDLNARIGEGQVVDENLLLCAPTVSQSRNSKDKTIDAKGKKLIDLVENLGGIFVNGRVPGDGDGDYTFCGVMGKSVIDYCICSLDFLQLINNFTIPSKVYSDHMPLTFSVSSKINLNTKCCSLPPKIYWAPNNESRYSNSLKLLSNCDYIHSDLPINDKVNILINKIYSANGKPKNKKYFQPKNKWYDCQCESARVHMFEKLNLFRKYNLSLFKNQYLESKTKYREICNFKKRKFVTENIEKLNKVKNVSDWWKLANSMKNFKKTAFAIAM